ncbi:MAG: hypothetical protein AB1439_12170 [candidate division FCPU426 bacterium]
MRKRLIGWCWVLSGFALAACSQGQPPAAQGDFHAYWKEFRAASLSLSARKAAAMTQFPFITRGEMDEDPEIPRDREWFERMYPAVLQADPGMRPEPETMLQLINRTPQVTERDYAPGSDFARVGLFEFRKINGAWKFVRAYWAE